MQDLGVSRNHRRRGARGLLRRLLIVASAAVLAASFASPVVAKSPAVKHTPKGVAAGHMVTNAERKAAAVKVAKAKKAKGGAIAAAIPGTNTVTPNGVTTAPGAPTGNPTNATLATPDYFGSVPNFANSPLPTSVSIQGDGLGAFATATVTAGSVTAINLIAQGSNYTFANVVVIGGGGTGGAGTATIDPASGAITAITLTNGGSGYDTVPGIRKFVDALPLPGDGSAANVNGQYLPIAVADTTTFAGTTGPAPAADYYEIAVVQYTQKLHDDLPATTLRGYVQIETPANASVSQHVALTYPDGTAILDGNNNPVFAVAAPQYLGPIIVAKTDRPVRIKFDNYLPGGAGGSLFLPVDPTIMGAGMGPNGMTPPASGGMDYSQNRATLHLHGGVTPWISDGTPDQWTTPTTSNEQYPKGVSTGYVPDQWYDVNGNDVPTCDGFTTCGVAGASTNPGPGRMTFYYTNQQSARLMFYHDHAYGITRLNVYAGEAAGYLLQDQAETALKAAGTLPADTNQLPLIIQDKTFVPSATQLTAEDPTWDTAMYGGYGNLWFPHVYMTNQNPAADMGGANPMGRWDYGPWFWPLFTTATTGEVPNPYCLPTPPAPNTTPANPGPYDCSASPGENPFIPGIPNPSAVPEGFMDTMLVNGTPYPYVQVGPTTYRLRILNASNDRTLNLSLYIAGDNSSGTFVPCTANYTGTGTNPCSEVPMVPAVKGGVGTAGYVWPDQLDGRDGGVPDSRAKGPAMVQIGTEGGLLSKPVTLKNAPVGYNYNRRDIVVLNVSQRSLTLGPAERADVLVDFSGIPAGEKVILYNDAPAPMPAFDSRFDYYTGDEDQVMTGGAPTTLPGYGPNTRTVMQFQVAGPVGSGISPNLTTGIEQAYGATQAAPVVPEQGYDAAFGTSSPADPYARIQSQSLTFNTGTVTGFTITNAGSGYTTPPTVKISGGGGSGATAQTVLSGGGVSSLSLVGPDFGGSGYTSPPTVTLDPPSLGGIQATATATLSTTVASVAVDPGSAGYTDAPSVTFSGGGATTNATGTALLTPSGVGSVTVTAPGSYTSPPTVGFSGGGQITAASGTAVLGNAPVVGVNLTNGGFYTSPPTVNFSPTGATGTTTLTPTSVASLSLTSGGSLFISAPTVSFSSGNASAIANLAATGSVGAVNVTNGGTLYTTPPTVTLGAPQTAGVQATAAVNGMSPTGVGSVRITNGGTCLTSTSFTVTFKSVNGVGSGATGTATIGGRPRRVTGVTITNPGSGYTMPPTPVFTAGASNCSGVAGTSALQPTSVMSIAVGVPGSGYTSPPRVNFNGGAGSGAAANAVLGRAVASLTLTSGGSGYTLAPTVTIAGPQFAGGLAASATATLTPTPIATVTASGGSYASAPAALPVVSFSGGGSPPAAGGAVATAILGPAGVASVTIGTAGSYTSAPAVAFTGGTGTGGATGTAALVPTSVASVNVTNQGSGYNTAPTVTIGPPNVAGTQATATAALTPAPVFALQITNAGSMYATAPNVTISAPTTLGGVTALAASTITGLNLSGFVITNPGSGYVSSPTVTLSAPPPGGVQATATASITIAPVTLGFKPMGIQELFEVDYGRMNATMSVEIPNTNGTNQTTIPYGYIDPPTDIVDTNAGADALVPQGGQPLATLPDGTQIWRFTHNGVDTHSLHFHMFNLELINRVGWDGMIRPPDPNEMGWKETIRMSPLEDAIVAIKPIVPDLPWPLPNSIRPLDVTAPLLTSGPQYTNVNPLGNPVTVLNHLVNFGWEYVFHCHLLGHEENDMMRPLLIGIAPISPTIGDATVVSPGNVDVTFTDNSVNETGFTIQRSADGGVTWANVGTVNRAAPVLNPDFSVSDAGISTGTLETFHDTGIPAGTYAYRVVANDLIGDTSTAGYPSQSIDSVPSGASASVTP